MFASDGRTIFIGLFDGHGNEGEHLTNLCVKEADSFFYSKMTEYESEPFEFLYELVQRIFKKIKEPGISIDVVSSGCTCVLSLIHKDTIYTINIGDSRGVLGTFKTSLNIEPRHITALESRNSINNISNMRRSSLTKKPTPLQLTFDHVTSNQSEFMRIIKSGGKLMQSSQSSNNKDAPYLVYAPHSNIPGIKLTRSIGDLIGENIGIISEPYQFKYSLGAEDEFVILGSAGIWEVMKNEEVVNFVAKYRTLANRKFEISHEICDVTPNNSCISQLLCEEARVRWLKKVENEDGIIEDISCVIIEFDQRVEKRANTFYRMPIERLESHKENENKLII